MPSTDLPGTNISDWRLECIEFCCIWLCMAAAMLPDEHAGSCDAIVENCT